MFWMALSLLLLGLVFVLFVFLLFKPKSQNQDLALQEQWHQFQNQMTQMMGQVSQSLQQQQMQVGQRMDSTSQLVASVQNQLGKLQQSTGQILEVGKDISSLQNILKAPKLRGSMGELFLGDLLSQILPGDSFELQYMFKNGSRVDAVVKLLHGLVSIDSKFPLEGFIRLQDAKEEEKASLQKQFARDVKKHIDDIASKYILPGEGTFDFALMYIPAENVYYETIIRYEKDDPGLWAYALTKRVIPVSPNSFIAYLQSLVLGFKGLKIEKSVKDIIKQMEALKVDFGKFSEDFSKMGTHIKNINSSYEASEKRLGKFESKLETIDSLSPKAVQTSLID